MTSPDPRIDRVAEALRKMHQICDRGFALAIHIRLIRPTLLYQTYSQSWAEHYSMKGYMLTDPVVRWGLENVGSVDWADLNGVDEAGVLKDAVKFGLTNGWTHSTGPAASRTISGTAKSGAPFTAAERAEIIALVDTIHDLTDGFEKFPAGVQEALKALVPGA